MPQDHVIAICSLLCQLPKTLNGKLSMKVASYWLKELPPERSWIPSAGCRNRTEILKPARSSKGHAQVSFSSGTKNPVWVLARKIFNSWWSLPEFLSSPWGTLDSVQLKHVYDHLTVIIWSARFAPAEWSYLVGSDMMSCLMTVSLSDEVSGPNCASKSRTNILDNTDTWWWKIHVSRKLDFLNIFFKMDFFYEFLFLARIFLYCLLLDKLKLSIFYF